MRFVIDETSWKHDHMSDDAYFAEVLASLEFILSRIQPDQDDDETQAEEKDTFFMGADLFTMEIVPGKTFFDLWDSSSDFHYPKKIQEVFAAVADRILDWATHTVKSSTNQVNLNSTIFDAPSIAWSAENKRQGLSPVACISLPSIRDRGAHLVTYAGADELVFFVASKDDDQRFARFEILCSCSSIRDLQARASRAFKNLAFREGVFSGIKDMSKGFTLMLPSIVEHLSVLSDEGARLFAGPAQQGFEGLALLGITASDENGNTKGNSKSMDQRTRNWNGKQVAFLWHTKIEPDRDRIHFYRDGEKDGRIVIGIFHRHLD